MSQLAVYIQILIALTFAVSSFSKLRSASRRKEFRVAVQAFGVPPAASGRVALGVSATEAVVAVAVIVGHRLLVPGLFLAVALLVGFTALLTRTVLARRQVRCNCFGGSGDNVGGWDIARNGVLIVAAAAGIILSLHRTAVVDLTVAPLLTAVAAVTLLLLLNAGDFTATLRRPFTVTSEDEA